MAFNYQTYISSSPSICGGAAVVTGTRITVRTLLASLAEGVSTQDLLAEYPTLTADALRAVIAFAAASAEEDLPPPASMKAA